MAVTSELLQGAGLRALRLGAAAAAAAKAAEEVGGACRATPLPASPACRAPFWPRAGGAGRRSSDRGAAPAWPEHVEWAHRGLGARGLVARGTRFERYMNNAAEPRKSGFYEFCVVGVDLSTPGQVRYYCWEPSGCFDRLFSSDEVDRQLALERFGRSVALGEKSPRAPLAVGQGRGRGSLDAGVVRWPDFAAPNSLVHGGCLPEVDSRGRPVLPLGSRFPPRNSTDLLRPLVLLWRRRWPPPPAPVCTADSKEAAEAMHPRRLLVLDGTGRFADHVQDEFPEAEVVAVDDPPSRSSGRALKLFRDRCHFPVSERGLDLSGPCLQFPDGAFEAVLLPFTLRRLCGGEEARLLRLLREALRVASGQVLLAEDVEAPGSDAAAFGRWKALFQAEWQTPILAEGELAGGPIADHFLFGRGAEADASVGRARRFLILQAAPTA